MRGLVGLLLTAAVAAGQGPTFPAVTPQPGSHGWPPQASPTVPPGQPSGVPVQENRPRGSELQQYPSATDALIAPTPADLGAAPPPADRVLPGSWADQFAREYDQRQRFRTCDSFGNRYSLFPTSLLWAPPLADKRAPRLAASYADDKSVVGKFDATLGTTLGLLRIDRDGMDGAVQLDVFGAAFTRFDGSNQVVTDYRGGVPLTFRRGDWFSRIAYEHTSSFLGDGLGPQFQGFPRPQYEKDEAVIGLGRWFEDKFRIYGQAAYAFTFRDDRAAADAGDKRKQRYQIGAEWFPWGLFTSSGWGGQPFVAINADFRGENDFSGDVAVQAGWLWRNPLQRLASVRVYAEYYSGKPLYGQFSRQDRDSYGGIGVAADY